MSDRAEDVKQTIPEVVVKGYNGNSFIVCVRDGFIAKKKKGGGVGIYG